MLQTLVFGTVYATAYVMPNTAVLWHHVDGVDAAGLYTRQYSQHDVGTIGDLKSRRISDHPANITRGYRIGDYANGASHLHPKATFVIIDPSQQTTCHFALHQKNDAFLQEATQQGLFAIAR
jgi:hypothetical protein